MEDMKTERYRKLEAAFVALLDMYVNDDDIRKEFIRESGIDHTFEDDLMVEPMEVPTQPILEPDTGQAIYFEGETGENDLVDFFVIEGAMKRA